MLTDSQNSNLISLLVLHGIVDTSAARAKQWSPRAEWEISFAQPTETTFLRRASPPLEHFRSPFLSMVMF